MRIASTGSDLSTETGSPEGPREESYFRAVVSYDGSDFLGFQWQATGRTVQGILESALAQVTQEPAPGASRVVGAGRTDAGVHASGQVVGFRAAWRHAVADLERALNAVLPADVAVRDLEVAAEGWHPRFSATWRHYRYTVLNRAQRLPLERRYTHLVTRHLTIERLQEAADLLVGTDYDFAAFGRPMQPGESTVRRILRAQWAAYDGPVRPGSRPPGRPGTTPDARLLTFDIVGNAFLRGMVRSLVGSLIEVGAGAWTVEQFGEVLRAGDRAGAASPAPACGLCLVEVGYS